MHVAALSIIPTPISLTALSCFFALSAATTLSTDGHLAAAARLLRAAVAHATGFALRDAETGAIRLLVDPALPPEGYRLRVTPDTVEIEAATETGGMWAVQTLLQLLPAANAPQLKRGRQARAVGQQSLRDGAESLRAVLYLRVSSKRQVSTDFDPEGISLPAQRLACEQEAQQQGFEIIDEYVEPGRTGTEMSKRVAFQQMLARIREQRDVDVVLVYKLSRLHRNRYDEANTMMTLQQHDVTLVSATEQIDATPVGQLMQGILSSFNQYRSAEDVADIRYKLGEKAKKGGTVFRAPLGYENVGVRVEDREVRTVQFDKERAPLVAIAFDLYASGRYSIPTLVDELTARGLTTRAMSARPVGPISENQLQRLLQDPYYLGLVRLKDQVYKGRHDALVNGEVFARVQEVIASQSTGERKRTHNHYLKGSLFCGRCFDTDGTIGWMIMANVRGRGGDYQYFFCRRRQEHLCDAPYIQLPRLEDAVIRFWQRQQVTEAFSKALREGIHRTVLNDQRATRSLHKQVSANLEKLDTQEQNLLDLAADGLILKATIHKRISAITKQRVIMTAQFENVERKLADVLDYIDAALSLLERPGEVYANATDEIRRLMNQALFRRIYVEVDEVTGAELNAPFDAILAADVAFQQQSTLANGKGAPMSNESLVIPNIALDDISSKRNMVEDLERRVFAVVEKRYRENVTGGDHPHAEHAFDYGPIGSSSGEGPMTQAQRQRLASVEPQMQHVVRAWATWPLRQSRD